MWSVVFYVISFWWVHVCVRNSNFSPRVKMGFEAIYCFFALFIFFCFRDITILNDTHAYFEWFDDLSHSAEHMSHGIWHVNALDRFEPGFQIYANMIMHFITRNAYGIIFISGLIVTIANILFIRKFTNGICLVVFLMLCAGVLESEYSGMRQGIAICVLYYAYFQLLKHRLFIFILCGIIATTLHSSAIVFFLLLILQKVELNRKFISITFIGGIIIAFFIDKVFEMLGLTDLVYYEQGMTRDSVAWAAIINTVISAIVLWFCYYIQRKYYFKVKDPLLWWMTILNVIFNMTSITFPIMTRFSLYFYPFIFILCILLINRVPSGKTRLKYINLIIIGFLLRFIVILEYKNDWNVMYPYLFYNFN